MTDRPGVLARSTGAAVAVPLGDLPQHHPGGMVLDRCFRPAVTRRDRDLVNAEYTTDKYASALAFGGGVPSPDPFAVRMFEFGRDGNAEWCFSRGDDLFRTPLSAIQREFDSILVERVLARAGGCASIVETGCGYGYNLGQLWRTEPAKAYLGGDLAETAIRLAKMLFSERAGPKVEVFDYYAAQYDLLERAEGPAFLFTCHSIEQLPSARCFIDGLAQHAGKIAGVMHFEPVYEVHGDTLLGRLRRAYADAVDYNRDLLSLLKQRDDVIVHSVEPNIFGINPLNPTSCIYWSFR